MPSWIVLNLFICLFFCFLDSQAEEIPIEETPYKTPIPKKMNRKKTNATLKSDRTASLNTKWTFLGGPEYFSFGTLNDYTSTKKDPTYDSSLGFFLGAKYRAGQALSVDILLRNGKAKGNFPSGTIENYNGSAVTVSPSSTEIDFFSLSLGSSYYFFKELYFQFFFAFNNLGISYTQNYQSQASNFEATLSGYGLGIGLGYDFNLSDRWLIATSAGAERLSYSSMKVNGSSNYTKIENAIMYNYSFKMGLGFRF
ncbi:MAG: autotransporter domain-containing protein [Bacteriovoracaceae bacterium]|nr:autotransporter domain-containing protein [Bacteriovoracaceae bacterium]